MPQSRVVTRNSTRRFIARAFSVVSFMSGRLEPYLESLMGEYEQSVADGRQSALDSLASSDSPEKVPQLNSLFAEIEETALNQVIEQMQATTASSRAS